MDIPVTLLNSGLLQARQLVLMGAELLSVRLTLAALGVSGYGVFAAVAGVVLTFALLHGLLLTLIQRFLSVAFTRASRDELVQAFSAGFYLTAGLCVLVALVGETVFLWFVSERMSFPPEATASVPLIFQLGLVTVILRTLHLPFYSLIVASERLAPLFGITVLEVAVPLVSAAAILSVPALGVVGYAGLLTGGAALLLAAYVGCCQRRFSCLGLLGRCRVSAFLEQGAFFLWSLLSTGANALKYQGVGVLVNVYAGILSSASWGVSLKVCSCAGLLISCFQQAFQPQLVRSWYADRREEFWGATARALRGTFLTLAALAVPFVVFLNPLLDLWLGETLPPDVGLFLLGLTVHCLIDALTGPLTTAIVATGRIARYQVGVSLAMGSGFVLAWAALASGWPAWTAAAAVACGNVLSLVQRLLYMRACMGLEVRRFLRLVFRIGETRSVCAA